MNRYSLADCIGHTPLVEVRGLHPDDRVHIYAKLEGCNPGGSIKDRAALYMIEKAEREGVLNLRSTIVEATSGNTGIALAMIGAMKGYRVVIVMPESVSLERRSVIMAYGAEVILTPGCEGTDGALSVAEQMAAADPMHAVFLNQYANEANLQAHVETTGPEIYAQMEGRIDAIVAGIGTSGTIMGVTRYLKEKIPGIRSIGVEHPPGDCIQGLKNMEEGRTPLLFSSIALDERLVITQAEAYRFARLLASKAGIFAGISSGAAMAGCIRVAGEMDEGSIVTIFPDRGDRYLTTDLFTSICGMCTTHARPHGTG